MIYPRQSGSMSSMDMSSMDMSMSGTSTMTGMDMGPSPTDSNSASNGGFKLSPAVIGILAAIGGAVVFIFIGFWIHARVREYKLKKHPHPSQQVASASLSVSTYVDGAQSKVGGALAAGSYSRIDQAIAPPMPTDYEEKQPATIVSLIPTDPEARLVPQRKDTATEAEGKEAAPYPQFAGHPYQEALQSNPSTPSPANLSPRPPPLPYILPGGMPGANDGYESTTLASGARSPAPTGSPRPLPRIPQLSRTASLSLTSEQRGDSSFLTFDDAGPDTRVDGHFSGAIQRPPDQNNNNSSSSSNNSNSINSSRALPSSAIRLMSVIMDYDPELPDELEVKVGDTVRILREYDDGWCVVEHVSRLKKRPGAIPRMCLQERD